MSKNLPPLVIYPSRGKTVLLIVISGTMLIIPILALLLWRDRIEEVKTVSNRLYGLIWVGICLFLVLGFAGLSFNLRQLTLPKAVVRISSQGIEPLWFGLIKWNEIERIAVVQVKGQCLLGIYPKDTDKILSRQTRLGRYLMERGIEQGFPPIYVTQLALPMAVHEVLAEIRGYTGPDLMIG